MLRYRIVMLGVFVAVIVATVQMFNVVPKGFIPDQDNDSLFVNLRAAQGTSYYDMVELDRSRSPTSSSRTRTSNRSCRASAATAAAAAAVGQQRPAPDPADAASLAAARRPQQIAQQLRPQLLRFPGFRGFVNVPSAIQIGGRQGNQNYSIMLQSLNTDELYQWAPRLEQAIAEQVPEVQDPSTDLEMKSPRINLVMDRDKAAPSA